ncbi:MAG TPA: TIGR00725 family protein [Haliangiales bacterium]|nr:TIGR00725 family protein [Haliangiales bacterium]
MGEGVMPPRRAIVAVIGDGTAAEGSEAFHLAEGLGEHLIAAGFRIVTGGYGGVMEAACRGARRSAAYRPGDTIGILAGHDADAANPYVDIVVPTGLGAGRNVLVAHADAVVAVGGGVGTLSEMAFAWMYGRLVVGFRIAGWSGRLAGQRLDHRVRFADIPDDQVFGADTPEEVAAVISARLPEYARAAAGR